MLYKPKTQVIFKISRGMMYYTHLFVNLDMSSTVARCDSNTVRVDFIEAPSEQ